MLFSKPKNKKPQLFMCCPECNSFNIENDYVHAEYFCRDCGLVISTNNNVKRLTIANFKPKPKILTDEEKLSHISDILIWSLNIVRLY